MAKYSTAILLFAVAFWTSVSARSLRAHYEEPHHGSSVENEAIIEQYLQIGFEFAEELFENSKKVAAYRNILHKAKHQNWNSLEELTKYLDNAVEKIEEKIIDGDSRRKRSIDSDSDEASEDPVKLAADKIAKLLYLNVLIRVAPEAHESALAQKFKEVLEKEYDDVEDFVNETNYIFKGITGDDVTKYAHRYETIFSQ